MSESPAGKPWTDQEIEGALDSYFQMLLWEQEGRRFAEGEDEGGTQPTAAGTVEEGDRVEVVQRERRVGGYGASMGDWLQAVASLSAAAGPGGGVLDRSEPGGSQATWGVKLKLRSERGSCHTRGLQYFA